MSDSLPERIAEASRLAAPIFEAHGWKWGYPADNLHVPSSEEIAQTIRRLYEQASTNEAGCCSSGRLSVYVDQDDGSISVDVQLAELRDEVPNWEETLRAKELLA